MKLFILNLILLIVISSCASFKAVELSPADLQHQILSGDLNLNHKAVKVTTTGGNVHEFIFDHQDQNHIYGKKDKIKITEIIALEQSEFDPWKSIFYSGFFW